MSGNFTVGKDCLSYCSKCKLNLAHTIVTMKDIMTIGKVKCNTCHNIHLYKDPTLQGKKVRSSRKVLGKTKITSVNVSDLWIKEMAKATTKPKKYNIRHGFVVGDIINHQSFGPGIVQEFINDKISVLFQYDIKTLVHNK